MTTLRKRLWIVAALLSAIAGFVDAVGFMALGGFFVSFMSGNSTRLGVGLAEAVPVARTAALLIGAFVFGATCGALLGHAAKQRRMPVLLLLIALLLIAAIICGTEKHLLMAGLCMAFAMGAENAIFERDGDVQIGLTYMTGALVKMSHRMALALRGGPAFDWLPYLLLWLGLMVGAIGGALAFGAFQLTALWIPAALCLLLGLLTALRPFKP